MVTVGGEGPQSTPALDVPFCSALPGPGPDVRGARSGRAPVTPNAESGAVRHEAKIASTRDCESDLLECVLVTQLPRFDELPAVSNSFGICVLGSQLRAAQ